MTLKQVPTNQHPAYKVQAVAAFNNVKRLAYNDSMDIQNQRGTAETTISLLIASGRKWCSDKEYDWQMPKNPADKNSPAKSPGSGVKGDPWARLGSQVLFNDRLGMDFLASDNLQVVFRVNYYIKLTDVAGSGSGSGYGVYYLANYLKDKKTHVWGPGNPGDPTAYVVQFDPGLNPTFDTGGQPYGGAWGARFSDPVNKEWPYGAFLVKKVWSDGSTGWQNEVWDNEGKYLVHCAFQRNNELQQRCYLNTPPELLNLEGSELASKPALQPRVVEPGRSMPDVTRVPTTFGLNGKGVFIPTMTGVYNSRPPDLRVAFSLGHIAEGNRWQAGTYYPAGAKVAAGAYYADDPLNKRLLWVAVTAGKSSQKRPRAPGVVGETIIDGTVKWEAQRVPTSQEIAKYVVDNDISVAKISMADLKYRLDTVNGTAAITEPYNIPFAMVKGSKNKITVEFLADKRGNRVHLIRVNDVLALVFNDRFASGKYNIVPEKWELRPGSADAKPMGTGIKVWSAAAECYTADNFGQTVRVAKFGEWGW